MVRISLSSYHTCFSVLQQRWRHFGGVSYSECRCLLRQLSLLKMRPKTMFHFTAKKGAMLLRHKHIYAPTVVATHLISYQAGNIDEIVQQRTLSARLAGGFLRQFNLWPHARLTQTITRQREAFWLTSKQTSGAGARRLANHR